MVIKSCPLLMKDTETCVGSSLASYFVLFSLISFCFRWFRFISFSFRWFRFVSFRFCWFRFVSFRFVSFSLISFRFVSFRFVSFRFYFVSHFIGTHIFVDFVLLSLVSFYFVFISLISFRFVSFLLISFRFVSFSLISFRFVSFRFYFVSHFIGTHIFALLFRCMLGIFWLLTGYFGYSYRHGMCFRMSCVFVSSILFWFPQRTHYFWRVFRFLFMERKQDYNVTSVKHVKVCF